MDLEPPQNEESTSLGILPWIPVLLLLVVIVVRSSSRVWLFATPWTVACKSSLSLTISWSLPKVMSIALVMPSRHLILWSPLLLPSIFPSIRDFAVSQLFASDDQNTGVSASASVLPTNIQGWFPLRLTGLISLLSKRLPVVFSSFHLWLYSRSGKKKKNSRY